MDYLATATEMRRKAWEALEQSPDFIAFRAADNMVVDLGGQSIMPNLSSRSMRTVFVKQPRIRSADRLARASQPDVAETVLRERGPMQTLALMWVCMEEGAKIGGKKPANSFRSALSKDARFFSFRREGEYLWWLNGEPLPEGWGEATDDLLRAAASPNATSEEGGDKNEAPVTPR